MVHWLFELSEQEISSKSGFVIENTELRLMPQAHTQLRGSG